MNAESLNSTPDVLKRKKVRLENTLRGYQQLEKNLQESRRELRFIIMSGHVNDKPIQDLLPEPGIVFIQKPFSQNTLLHKVREILDKKE